MTAGVAIFVGLGIGAAVLLGIGMGFDRGAFILLGAIGAFGLLAIAVTRRSQRRVIQPGTCPHCGGLVSVTAPHCKHCGELLEPPS